MDIMPGPVGGAGATPDARASLLLSVPCAGEREGRQPTLWCDAGRMVGHRCLGHAAEILNERGWPRLPGAGSNESETQTIGRAQ